jgi:DNA-binding MarR family transcriptional regulator
MKLRLPEGPLSALIGFQLARARVTTQAMFARHVGEPLQLRPVDYSLLMLVRANRAATPKQLSAALALPAPALTGVLDRLHGRALIERIRSAVDRRSHGIELTAEGQAFVDRLTELTPGIESDLAASLSTAERAMLLELLDKVAGHSTRPD